MTGQRLPNHPHPNPPPHVRERERTSLVPRPSPDRERIRQGARFSSLSRLRGRVARASGRDGWGLARLRMTGKG